MRAPVFKGVGNPLEIAILADPTPGPGEVVLRVGCCGICGTDLHYTDGPSPTYPAGTVIGHEFAGEVVALGPGVVGYGIGDRIVALPVVGCGSCPSCYSGDLMWCEGGPILIAGGGGEYAIAKAHASIRLPDTLSYVDGALIEPLAVALHAVKLSGMVSGARVLILGSGPIGVATAFWARRFGASRVVVSSRSRRSEHIAMILGATHFLTRKELAEHRDGAIGGFPDVVFECVGVPGLLADAIELVRPRGTVVVLGNCKLPDTFVPGRASWKHVCIQCSIVYNVQEFGMVADVLRSGAVEPRMMITDTVGLAALPGAFEALRNPVHQCKLMIDPWA